MAKNIYAITSSYAFTPEKIKNPKIIISDNIIHQIGTEIKIPSNMKVIDFKDKIILPGFIDVHLHGAVGYDFYSEEDKINKITQFLAKKGTTSCLATLYPVEFETMKRAISSLVSIIKRGTQGAKIIGINLEGPYLNKNSAGALSPELFREINISEIEKLVEVSDGYLKIITIAPELKNAEKAIKFLTKNKVLVSLGHSQATYREAKKAINGGATLSTHTFNAMSQLHHREPSLLGAALLSDRVYCEVICDGVHIHPEIVKLLCKVKGREKVILVSDAISALGRPEGEYEFSGKKVILKNNKVITKEGKLSGSVLSMNTAFSNVMRFAKMKMGDAVYLSSNNQAELLKINNLGKLKEGNIADMVIVDKKLNVCQTIIEGKLEREMNIGN